MFLTNDDKKTLGIYSVFNLLILITNLLAVSFVAFFHFQLNHQLGDIENWLNSNAWPIIIFVKVICFIVFFSFYTIGPDSYLLSFKKIIKKSRFIPSLSVLVVCLSIYFLIGSMGKYAGKNDFLTIFDIHKFLSFLGTFVFYFVDFLVIYILNFTKEISLKQKILSTLIFYIFSRVVIPYHDHVTIMIALHFFTMQVFSRNKNLGDPLFYLFFVISLFSILWGLDPIWGAEFAFYKLELVDIAFYYISCWCLCLAYYSYRAKNPSLI